VLLQGFYRGVWSVGVVLISTGVGDVPAGFGDTRTTGTTCGRCNQAWAHSMRSGRALQLAFNAPSPSLRGTEGEVSATPIDRVVDCGFLIELLVGGSSGRPCPVR
jgi:hypothetical protein